jgi:hypothetical protein
MTWRLNDTKVTRLSTLQALPGEVFVVLITFKNPFSICIWHVFEKSESRYKENSLLFQANSFQRLFLPHNIVKSIMKYFSMF